MSAKIIVIGASAASMAFMAKLRSLDTQSNILCFTADKHMPYNRCLLADFLTQDIDLNQLFLKPEQFFEQSKIALHLNHRAIKFNFEQKQVLIQNAESEQWHEYDYLFLGVGARPNIPQFLDKDTLSGIFTFHTLSDMQQIEQFLQHEKPKSAIVLGAGLNGVEAASSLVRHGVSVTLVQSTAQILPGQLDEHAAAWITNLAQKEGVGILTGQKVTEILSNQERFAGVVLKNGTTVSADMLIITAGSIPNSNIFKDTNLSLNAGLVAVDDSFKTNFDSVFAAGDICMVPDFKTGQLVRSTTWSDAMLQGLCAATTLSSNPRTYIGAIGLRDSYFFGKDFYACGKTVGFDAAVEQHSIENDATLQKWYVQNGALIGFVLIGDISRLSEFKQWYMRKI